MEETKLNRETREFIQKFPERIQQVDAYLQKMGVPRYERYLFYEAAAVHYAVRVKESHVGTWFDTKVPNFVKRVVGQLTRNMEFASKDCMNCHAVCSNRRILGKGKVWWHVDADGLTRRSKCLCGCFHAE